MKDIRLEIYSHAVRVTGFSNTGKLALLNFCRTLAQFQSVRTPHGHYVREMVCIYAGAFADRSEFWFHRHCLDDLLSHLTNFGHYRLEDIEQIHVPMFEPVRVDFKANSKYIPREDQVPLIDFLGRTDKGDFPLHSRVATMQTGGGKTICALLAIAELGLRTVICIKGMYIPKWVNDVEDMFKNHKGADWKKGDLLVVRGSSQLSDLIAVAKAGELTAKVIIISNTTYLMYINAYTSSNGTTDIYSGVAPIDFFRTVGAGVRLIDELHQDFHGNFKQEVFTHVQYTIGLSATMEPDDKFLDRMYKLLAPTNVRYQGGKYNAYISVTALFYGMQNARRLRCKRRGNYSHVVFEQQIMKDKPRLAKYLTLIEKVVESFYLDKRKEGQTCLIFAATIDFCAILSKHLEKVYKQCNVGLYVGGVDYSVFLESEIVVSTLKSAGTAVDKANLKTCIMTDALNTGQGNEQTLGRLRELKNYPGDTPLFVYFVCADIEKHVTYHKRKRERFAGKVIAHKEVQSGHVI